MRVAIVDDDTECVEQISRLIKSQYNNIDIDAFYNGDDFVKGNFGNYSIVFLDIEIGNRNGIDLATLMRKEGAHALIFFITNYTKYISQSFKTIPFQYIVKPIDENLFARELARAVKQIERSNKELEVKTNEGKQYVKLKDILYIEYASRKVIVHTKERTLSTYDTMKNILSRLKDYNFARCHSGYIVNIQNIQSIKGNEIAIHNGDIIPISRQHSANIRTLFLKHKAGVEI